MPTFDLRGIRVAKYNNNGGAITYTDHTSAGDAMGANLELKFAEGRLYSEGSLAEYLKLATGGTISLAVKYIPTPAQVMMYGAKITSRTVGEKTVNGLKFTTKDVASYVGCSFYAPDLIDGVQKYTCVFAKKALFGPPALAYKTKGDTITFNTPTTTGEFLPDDSPEKDLMEVAIADDEATAIAWCDAVLSEAASSENAGGDA